MKSGGTWSFPFRMLVSYVCHENFLEEKLNQIFNTGLCVLQQSSFWCDGRIEDDPLELGKNEPG